MPLGEKRKNLIKWIKELIGDDETPEAANDSTDAEAHASEEDVEGPTGEVGASSPPGDDEKTSDKEEKSDDDKADTEDTTSEDTTELDGEAEKTAEEPKKEEPATKAKEPDKKVKVQKKKPKTDSDDAPDPIHDMVKQIETINDVAAIEPLAFDLLQQDKVNEFQLGGYLLRLQNSDGKWGSSHNN